jgi:hypothetical protein
LEKSAPSELHKIRAGIGRNTKKNSSGKDLWERKFFILFVFIRIKGLRISNWCSFCTWNTEGNLILQEELSHSLNFERAKVKILGETQQVTIFQKGTGEFVQLTWVYDAVCRKKKKKSFEEPSGTALYESRMN